MCVCVCVCFQGTPLDVFDTGKSLKVQAERPHLVSLGSGRLSIAITLLPLLEGKPVLARLSLSLFPLFLYVHVCVFLSLYISHSLSLFGTIYTFCKRYYYGLSHKLT